MERMLEPMLMDEVAGARAYAASDFSEPHNAFVKKFQKTFPDFSSQNVKYNRTEGRVNIADLGCGNADVTIRFAQAHENAYMYGFDGSSPMLELGRYAALRKEMAYRVVLNKETLPDLGHNIPFDAVISNSLLHHLPDQNILWDTIKNIARPEAPVFIMDLTRPQSIGEVRKLVKEHAKGEPELMQRDFFHSLRAAFRPEEVRVGLDNAGLKHFKVEVTSDRHMAIYGKL